MRPRPSLGDRGDGRVGPAADRGEAGLPRPFEGNYGVSLLVAILALVPYIIVTSAYVLYRDQVSKDIAAGPTALEIVNGLSTAGYAFGALSGGDLINRFRQRHLFLLYEAVFVLGCALSAAAGGLVVYGAGRVLQGLATGSLLVIALPPVIRRFPPERMPTTAAAVNIGFFGAVTIGPLIGGITAYGHAWRWFYAGLGGVGCAIFALAVLTLPHQEPPNRGMRFDAPGLALGLAATVLPFWAVGELGSHGFGSLLFAIPLAIGLACFVALLLVEYHQEEPLSPVKRMWHTFPIVGTLAAMIGGAAFVTFVLLAQQFLLQVEHQSPLAAGLAFWPQVVGVLVTAAMLGLLLRTRFLPILIVGGMVLLMAGGGLLLTLEPGAGARTTVLAAAGLLGLGAGATVAPGLYLAGFSLPSKIVGRTFALVELVRSIANFILAPIMLQVARAVSDATHPSGAGIREALWITLAVAFLSTVGGAVLFVLGGVGLPRPDIAAWINEDRPAIGSPKLARTVRH